VWAIFFGAYFNSQTCAYSGVKNDRTKSAFSDSGSKLELPSGIGQRIKGSVCKTSAEFRGPV
jgi:hypothetical protein